MKKATGLILCFILLLSSTVPAFGSGSGFSDIHNHWAKNAILEAQEKGLVGGYPDGSFKPNERVSYGMVFTVLDRIFSQLSPTYNWELSETEEADFDVLFDKYILTFLQDAKTHFQSYDDPSRSPENVRAMAQQAFEALQKDLNNFENLKKKYAFSKPVDLYQDHENFVAELSFVALLDDFAELAESYSGELGNTLVSMNLEELTLFQMQMRQEVPFLSFYLDYVLYAQYAHLSYFFYIPQKMNYILKTQELSETEKLEIQKQIIRFTLEDLTMDAAINNYAYSHYIHTLMGMIAANGPYTYIRPGVYAHFHSVNFQESITRDALFGLINQLLLSASTEYEDHNDMLAFSLLTSVYEETANLFTEDIETLVYYKLVQGSGTETGNARLHLSSYLTRAELATMAVRLYDFLSALSAE